MKKMSTRQQLADTEAALMYLKVDMNKFNGEKESKEFLAMLAEESRLSELVESLTELVSAKRNEGDRPFGVHP